MNKSFHIIMALVAMMMVSVTCSAQTTAGDTYTNPVWGMSAPDPCILRASDGYFYAYTTQGRGPKGFNFIQVLRSPDLVTWEHLGDALPQRPEWAKWTTNFWAPHVTEYNGKYYMFYSAEPTEKSGSGLALCLAVAVSDSPAGPFVDKGEPLLKGKEFINIDPMAFQDPKSGKWYLYWGSGFEPLKVRELSDDLLNFREESQTYKIIQPYQTDYQKLVEGAWVIYREPYYYIFYSGDNCCGERAHYAVMVARSESPTGPFKVHCIKTQGDYAILQAGGHWVAPGHNSIVRDDHGQDWIFYHAIDRDDWWVYPGSKTEDKRVLMLDPIIYTEDGWPEVPGRKPSDGPNEKPYFETAPTAISDVSGGQHTAPSSDVLYDVSGKRAGKNQKGVVIGGGRKYVKK